MPTAFETAKTEAAKLTYFGRGGSDGCGSLEASLRDEWRIKIDFFRSFIRKAPNDDGEIS